MMNSHQQFLLPIKVRARQRIHSEPLDPEEDVTKKRKNEISPNKGDEQTAQDSFRHNYGSFWRHALRIEQAGDEANHSKKGDKATNETRRGKKIIKERWPQGCFKNTKVNTRGKLYEEENILHSILLYPDNIIMDKNYKALLEKIPAIGAITDDKVK